MIWWSELCSLLHFLIVFGITTEYQVHKVYVVAVSSALFMGTEGNIECYNELVTFTSTTFTCL